MASRLPLSTARLFFDELIVGGASAIEALVTNQQHETEWLDFKAADHLDDAQIKSVWGEAIRGLPTTSAMH